MKPESDATIPSSGGEVRPEDEQFEKIKTVIFPSADEACRLVAGEIADLIREREAAGRKAVLGLATGSTPVRLYRELIRLHREAGLSFKNVVTFNLDEYYPIERSHRESYYRFMREQLFEHVDILPENVYVPDGTLPRQEVYAYCQRYEKAIREAGGIDLQILGIGRTGHIGFNEPGSLRESRTRLVTLDGLTRRDAARDFFGEANVPRYAITMGVGTVLDARRIVLLAWGEAKARVIAQAVEGPASDALPASFLQGHPDTRFLVDEAAAAELTRRRHPWRVGPVQWAVPLSRRAVVWLAQSVNKPVLKLVDGEYAERGMAELLTEQGPAYSLNIRIFNELQQTITGWPGGKPDADDTHRPERAVPFPKRILVLSPEPRDDVLCMGGTLHRLVGQGHEVTVAYQTSGSLAVSDEEAVMSTELILDLAELQGTAGGQQAEFARKVREQIERKEPFDVDSGDIRRLKAVIRRGEARAACRVCGVSAASGIRFLDLPFYESGRYRQFFLGEGDVAAVRKVLEEIRPHQVYATGSRADPSSVEALCFEAFRRAWCELRSSPWTNDCYVWLYRGAEKEWETHEIEMAVPLSPDELGTKIKAIYQHQSQRSQIPASENNLREAWQQAESRNRATAEIYDALGLAEYEALEAFKRWKQS